MVQALLEKFEFFPVKCRVQRALEIAEIERAKDKSDSVPHPVFKTKASATPAPAPPVSPP